MKKIKIIAAINIFLLSFFSHFVYNIFPNTLISFFFPVNESIFEHMKIIFTTTILYGIIDYLLLKKNKIPFSNFPFQLFITSFLGIILYLILYLPIRAIFNEYLPTSIFLLLIIYIIMQVLSYHILNKPKIPIINKLSIPFIIITYIIFIFFTYYPPHNMLFYDTNTKTYGIPPLTSK